MSRSVVLQGSWRVTVIRKDSDWAQRVVVTGAAQGIVPGVVGASETMSGERWSLGVEHDWGRGWQTSEYVHADPVKDRDGRASRIVASKDHYWPGDSHPNDLVLLLDFVGATFEVTAAPCLVGENLRDDGARYLAVPVRNSGYRAFGYETVLDVTDASRDALARGGVVVEEDWEPSALRTTGQETYGRAVVVPPLDPGGQSVVYFPVRAGSAVPGEGADVELVLTGTGARERQVARMPGRPRVRPAPVAGGGSVVSGDVVGVRASTRPPAGRPAPATPRTAPSAPGATVEGAAGADG
ncbi:hypothetical protein [Actinomadura sp. DC4]|uniref:hypothetical protein n=1 Tax=Actinomadura sp. DC4 TaxID=3055069 RepID=UPI0025B1DC96|nr:hypothetical protein [Actinomadura sp. DC4]MDN3357659.1 hypothetical protein [Actinomadura sp. DC4]